MLVSVTLSVMRLVGPAVVVLMRVAPCQTLTPSSCSIVSFVPAASTPRLMAYHDPYL